MRDAPLAVCLGALLLLLSSASVRAEQPAAGGATLPAVESRVSVAPVEVLLHTQSGDIVIALDAQHAPLTTANFLRYVDEKRYDGAVFYRAVQVDDDGNYGLVQGGLHGSARPTPKHGPKGSPVKSRKPIPPVAHESPAMTGLRHVDGAVSMARTAPGTATSEFFIVVGELTSLDGKDDDPGYAVFGHVQSGMELVHQMLGLPRSADAGDGTMRGQMLAEPVKILSARRFSAAD